ncbi:adenylate cyclase type 9 isoform X2 [Frieseomelitta varia]|uniref:adenylate cyclase type 9 isoform X2 n=1 Tax=Frieseomelitta varia TaxID=561572 RepID=UPI001CB687CE|nr:adenylate cyclase type 9 isoform X2 [Frieseomelitta varia]
MSSMSPPLNRKRSSSVSFTRAKDDSEDATDEIHISLAPYIQTYLAHSGQGLGCCGISLPVPFERAAPRSWWNPKFDSEILEEQFKRSAFPQIRLRFRYALTYILLVSLSWLVYFVVIGTEYNTTTWPAIAAIFTAIGAMVSAVLYLTHRDYYKSYVLPISLGVATILCILSLLFLTIVPPYIDGLTLVGHFALCSEILLLIYTVLPMPLYACVGISMIYSFLFEFLTAYLYGTKSAREKFFSKHILLNTSTGSDTILRNFNNNQFSNVMHDDNESTTTSMKLVSYSQDSKLLSALEMKSNQENIIKRISGVLNDTNVFKNLNSSITSTITNINSAINASSNDLISKSINNETEIHKNGEMSNYLLNSNISNQSFSDDYFSTSLGIRILMQICIHLIGIHILIMTFVRMRGTFMKVGQSLLVRRQLEMEKQLKEKMIHSVMPPKVADWLMEESEREREREDSLKKGSIPSNNTDIRSLFRPFNMHSMENVSILFADIVGFTRMSSNKTAEELVGILNDLFERFDDLCEHHGCEKISTLGDCYYCVSGCPEPRTDHAKCCVEMGLAMIEAIKQFDIERKEGVNMRVGVHTGTVLCGIVGTKRFKFDVWSNDVSLANKLESTGKPGRVHLSEKTLNFLNDGYITEEGDLINGIKTYFIKSRKSDFTNQFIMNITSPTSISPLMQSRQRVASCNSQSKSKYHYLHMVTNTSNYRMKANSLPSILDSENGDTDTADEKENANKSPISVASYGKKKGRNKPWKYLQRQRTTEEMTPLEMEEAKAIIAEKSKIESQSYEDRNGFRQNTSQNEIEMDPNPVPSSPLLSGQEPLSRASSMCSRKDSGIRSNSRRSSIQQQLFLMNGMAQGDLLGHRVSGYYTSSSTLNSVQEPSSSVPPYPFPPAVTDTFGACFHKLRKQSDLQLIRCVQDNVSSQRSYFVKPPLSSLTLFFKNKEMEKEYRENAHKWYPWHICGAFLVGLPITSILLNYTCNNFHNLNNFEYYYGYLIFIGLIHFCNFTQLNCWMKNFLVTFMGVLFLYLVMNHHNVSYDQENLGNQFINSSLNYSQAVINKRAIDLIKNQFNKTIAKKVFKNTSNFLLNSTMKVALMRQQEAEIRYHERLYNSEIFLDMILLLLLVWFLNREFEISYRLSFHGNAVAARDKSRVQSMKNQADWLLHNIIPKYVADQLKTTAKYSQNHKAVGIIFASIVNFNELYDESYLAGKEYLRVLNELIGDFDELLEKPEFSNVEKIKTIGSTFMAASGLNPQVRQQSEHEYMHLFQLIDFSVAMHKVINDFNRELLGFKLILRIGFNYGDVTAGVIGATKLYYDIWGDAVNIASRMDSTGVAGRIQVAKNSLNVLSEQYEFEPRGQVYVKGKDNMDVFLLIGKKSDINTTTNTQEFLNP